VEESMLSDFNNKLSAFMEFEAVDILRYKTRVQDKVTSPLPYAIT
jgi:hypothetical protein